MILAGTTSDKKISSEEVAKLTIKCLKENVPTDVPGIAFFIWWTNRSMKLQRI